jgi:hypothetical protein
MTSLAVALVAVACGKPAGVSSGGAPAATPTAAVDTSTPDDWRANCAARYHYRNELIFTTTETVENGRRVGSLSTARAQYVAAFTRLKLDGVPDLKAQRDQIMAMADKAPGGARISIGAALSKADRGLWEEVVRLAKAHDVDCQAFSRE